MEVDIKDITEVEKEISIRTTASEIAPQIEDAYKRYLPTIEIKGFRKGKAPLSMVKKLHGEMIEYKELDSIASEVYRKVLSERNIRPIGSPVLTDMDYKRGEELTFKIKYEVKPVIALKEYKKIPLEKAVHTVTDEDVENEVSRIRQANSTREDVRTAADAEHVITADIQQLDETGSPLIGKKNTDMKIYLAGGTVYKEIKEALIGASAGETRRVRFEVEKEEVKQINNLDITIKKVEKVVLPELNDEFVKSVTKNKVATVAEFRTGIRNDIERYVREEDNRHLVDHLVSEIVRRHEFTVPESLVNGVLESMIEEIRSRNPNKTLPPDFDDPKFREANRPYAFFQAKWYLIRERIIETEHLTVGDDELEALAKTEAPGIGIEPERLLAFYKSSDSIRDRMLGDKLMKFLLEHSSITEIPAEAGEPKHEHH